eukprot:Rhum_TRINITY_DN10572_c0_g1::Rhum_TRINITY_DN10572_c0_g1_i1::g.39088::m.39088
MPNEEETTRAAAPGMLWSRTYDLSSARHPDEPFAPLGRAPEEGELFCVDEQGYRSRIVRGCVYNHTMMTKEGVCAAMDGFDLPAQDVVICTYPKCGTTWMQNIVLAILAGGDSAKLSEEDLFELSPWIEQRSSAGQDLTALQPPFAGRNVWKTHAPASNLPWRTRPATAKMIVVSRNPYDAVVSHFHHSRDVDKCRYSGSFDHFLHELSLKGVVEYGDFWEWHGGHYAAYKAMREAGEEHTLWVTFEDMKADLGSVVSEVCRFLGVTPTDALVASVAGQSAFEAMKAKFDQVNQRKAAQGEWYKKNHIRQGSSGAWRRTVTVAQYAAVAAANAARCAEHGLPPDMFGEGLPLAPAAAAPVAALRAATPPHAPLGRPPAEGEVCCADAHGGCPVRFVEGHLFPAAVDPAALRAARSRRVLDAGDVVVCTHGPTGSAAAVWGRAAAAAALGVSAGADSAVCLEEETEEGGTAAAAAAAAAAGRVLATRAPAGLLPWRERAGARMIVVAPGPCEGAEAVYSACGEGVTRDEFVRDVFLAGAAEHGDYWGWHAGHRRAADAEGAAGAAQPRTLWLTCKRVRADPEGT